MNEVRGSKEIANYFELSHTGSASFSINKIKKGILAGEWKRVINQDERRNIMKKYVLVFALSTTAFLSGCANLSGTSLQGMNLPGTFPNSGVFKGSYVKKFQPSDIVGEWNMIANGRIYSFEVTMSGGKHSIKKSSLGTITNVNWDANNLKLSFKRTVSKTSPRPDTIQDFTGYLMTYSKESNPQIDYKWRIAGTFKHEENEEFMATKPTFPLTSGWYATRPRK